MPQNVAFHQGLHFEKCHVYLELYKIRLHFWDKILMEILEILSGFTYNVGTIQQDKTATT